MRFLSCVQFLAKARFLKASKRHNICPFVNALFSGFYGLVHDENHRSESLKLLLKKLKLLQLQSSFEKLTII